MTSTSSWKSLQKPRQSTTIVKLPVNTAFPNPWWENGATSNMSFFSGELRMTAKRASMGCYRPKDPELDQQLADWFSDQWTQGKHLAINLDLYWWIVINVSEPRSLQCDVYIQWLVSITKMTFGFVVTQVCQSTAWCFEWRPKNSAPTPSLKRPLAGTRTGSAVTPFPWEGRPVLLSVSQPTWKTSLIHSSWDLASAGATI